MLRNLRTVRPIFPKIAPKVAQDFKEKSNESLRRGKNSREIIARNVEGGQIPPPPPPPPPGPFSVKVDHRHDPIPLLKSLHWLPVKKKSCSRSCCLFTNPFMTKLPIYKNLS